MKFYLGVKYDAWERFEKADMYKKMLSLALCLIIIFLIVIVAFADNKNMIVYVTLSGKKYHDLLCRHIKESRLLAITLEEAVFVGYEPCKTCEPVEADFSTYGWPEYGVLPHSSESVFDWWQPAA